MTRFTSTVRTDDVLHVDPDIVWQAMHDPDLLARLAPAVAQITTHGQRWCWRLVGIKALGVSVAPSFTERMSFDDGAGDGGAHDCNARRIDFAHDPPPAKSEAAGATGTYHLLATDRGTYVGLELTAHVDLPLPGIARGAVQKVMARTIVSGGQRFADNLLRHLDISSRGMLVVPLDVAFPRATTDARPS
ncbi:MAG TPA: hypothetical protein VMM13_12430 [Euzebya sp.]|nr:hypothetical protein [Euzebya sp.]